MSEPIIIRDPLKHPGEGERMVMAVAQYFCCPGGCRVDGLGCRAASFRDKAVYELQQAVIRSQ